MVTVVAVVALSVALAFAAAAHSGTKMQKFAKISS